MKKFLKAQWRLVFYDTIIFGVVSYFCYKFPSGYTSLRYEDIAIQILVSYVILMVCRFGLRNYNRI